MKSEIVIWSNSLCPIHPIIAAIPFTTTLRIASNVNIHPISY